MKALAVLAMVPLVGIVALMVGCGVRDYARDLAHNPDDVDDLVGSVVLVVVIGLFVWGLSVLTR